MPDEILAQYAESAYNAYGATTGFKNFQGNPMPKWGDLPEGIKSAWIAAVSDVLKNWDLEHTDRGNEFPLLTPEEWDVYSALSIAWNRFVALPVLFVGDRPDFAKQINALKSLVMSRAVAREMVKRGWSGYGE